MSRIKINSLFLILFFLTVITYAQNKNIRVISPNGGEQLTSNLRYGISWISENIESVDIYYSITSIEEWILIADNLNAELGHFSWEIPTLEINTFKIKIVSSLSNNIFDVSDEFSNVVIRRKKLSKTFENGNIKILPLGNSITFDNRKNDTRPVEDKISYRYPLYTLLKNEGYNFEFIGSEHSGSNFFPEDGYDANAGFPGVFDYEINDLLETGIISLSINGRVDTLTNGPYLDTYSPDIILLHIGTNGNEREDGTSPIDVENILDEIDSFENLYNTEVTVFLSRIVNRVPNETFVTELNDNVSNMVLDRVNNPQNDAYPDKIVLVDMENIPEFNYTISPDPNGTPGDMHDFLHPNAKGYIKLANTWFNALETHYNQPLEFVEQPKSIYVVEGEDATLRISTSGKQPVSIQWKRNGVNLIGETDSVLNLQNISLMDSGNIYTCVATNLIASIESDSAEVFVTGLEDKVSHGLQVLYNFNEGFGNKVYDQSEILDTLNLKILNLENSVWHPKSLNVNANSEIYSSTNAEKIYNSLTASDEMTCEIWFKGLNNNPQDLARIVTFSQNQNQRNFSLLQNQNKYEFRLRTTSTDNNGLPSLSTSSQSLLNKLNHIVFTISKNDTARLFLNGNLEEKRFIGGSFANWDSTYNFGISNEFIDPNPWLGSYFHLGIYDRALTTSEVTHNFSLGIDNINLNIISPTNLFSILNGSNSIELSWSDNSNIESGYIVQRKMSDSAFKTLNITGPNITNYFDSQIKEGRIYIYAVSSYNTFGESISSNLASITTPLTKPTGLDGILNDENNVVLSWQDNSQGELGYIIEGRADVADSSFHFIGSVDSNIINFIDDIPKSFSPYVYRVVAFTQDVVSEFSNEFSINVVSINNSNSQLPNYFELKQNYPNPFNPNTNIEYAIPGSSEVSLTIYNTLGQKVEVLVNSKQATGYYNVNFDASKLNSGVYFYVLEATGENGVNAYKNVKKLLLIK